MKTKTVEAFAGFIEAQRMLNSKVIGSAIELAKLIPPGPAREPVIESLQAHIDSADQVSRAAEILYEAMRQEIENAARP